MLNVQIASDLKEKVKELARFADMSQAQVVEFILDGYFNDSLGADLLKNIGGIRND